MKEIGAAAGVLPGHLSRRAGCDLDRKPENVGRAHKLQSDIYTFVSLQDLTDAEPDQENHGEKPEADAEDQGYGTGKAEIDPEASRRKLPGPGDMDITNAKPTRARNRSAVMKASP